MDDAFFLWLWGVGFGVCLALAFIAWLDRHPKQKIENHINIDPAILHAWIQHHGYVLMPKGVEWTAGNVKKE